MLTHDNKRQTDFKLVSALMDNKPTAWAELYDTYAPMMYGLMLNITGNEEMAGNLLQQAFVDLKNRELLLRIQASLCVSLAKHCCNLTLKYLKIQGLSPQGEILDRQYKLIHFFYFEDLTLTEIAVQLAMPEFQVIKNLQAEFKEMRKRA